MEHEKLPAYLFGASCMPPYGNLSQLEGAIRNATGFEFSLLNSSFTQEGDHYQLSRRGIYLVVSGGFEVTRAGSAPVRVVAGDSIRIETASDGLSWRAVGVGKIIRLFPPVGAAIPGRSSLIRLKPSFSPERDFLKGILPWEREGDNVIGAFAATHFRPGQRTRMMVADTALGMKGTLYVIFSHKDFGVPESVVDGPINLVVRRTAMQGAPETSLSLKPTDMVFVKPGIPHRFERACVVGFPFPGLTPGSIVVVE